MEAVEMLAVLVSVFKGSTCSFARSSATILGCEVAYQVVVCPWSCASMHTHTHTRTHTYTDTCTSTHAQTWKQVELNTVEGTTYRWWGQVRWRGGNRPQLCRYCPRCPPGIALERCEDVGYGGVRWEGGGFSRSSG